MKKIIAISGSITVIIFSLLTICSIQIGGNSVIGTFALLTATSFIISAIAFATVCLVETAGIKLQPVQKQKGQALYYPMYTGKSPCLRKKIKLLTDYIAVSAAEKMRFLSAKLQRKFAWR